MLEFEWYVNAIIIIATFFMGAVTMRVYDFLTKGY